MEGKGKEDGGGKGEEGKGRERIGKLRRSFQKSVTIYACACSM